MCDKKKSSSKGTARRMTIKTCLWLTSLSLTLGLVSLAAQDPAKKSDEPTVFDRKKAKAASPKKPARGGHYVAPRERKLDELISKIRTAEESGRKYEGRRPMTDADRERAKNRRMKVEGGANFRDGIAGAESEYALAVDPSGQNIVVGYNLFAADPNGLSGVGVAYSVDGGQTFQDGGFLPSPGNQSLADGTQLPQVLSDPDVKWVPGGNGCNFVYSSIITVGFPANTARLTGTADTLGIHRSTDCGKTWAGPFEVTPATNPNGLTTAGSAYDGSDKEFMDVNLETGRVMLSWSNFTSTRFNADGVEVCVTYSDDVMSGNPPTWSKRTILNRSGDGFGTGSVPRFGPKGTQDVYVAYSLAPDDFTRKTQVAASHDGGATWSFPVNTTTAEFASMDDVLGNDRVNEFPSMAVDTSSGQYSGNVYVVFSDNDSLDGSDVAFQSSRDHGNTWSTIKLLNLRPGQDRGQWFPYVAADKNTGRVSVIFYDQSVQDSGDLVQVLMTYSDDGGATWTQPSPLTDRPFHAAYGNDSSAPNLGDYIGSVAQNGTLYAVWAGTPNSVAFTDGQPGFGMSLPTLFFKRFSGTPSPTVDVGTITTTSTSADGFLRPGDSATLNVALRNPITNSISATKLTGITSVLSTSTPGVTVVSDTANYPDLDLNATSLNNGPFQVALAPDFAAGTPIQFILDVTSANGTSRRLFTQRTGAPQGTVLLSEDFESVTAGVPTGWILQHGAGTNTVGWTTSKTFCNATSNGLFHIDAEDGRTASNSYRWERAFSPTFNVPSDAQWVTVDFDLCYDTEEDVLYPTIAYDGMFLQIRDLTPGRAVRSVLADAFAETLVTGSLIGYPRHLADDRNANYFGDTSAWSGTSNGMQHVTIRLPGMAGSSAQLRFEYTQDQFGTCKDVRVSSTSCGVLVDNIVVRSIKTN